MLDEPPPILLNEEIPSECNNYKMIPQKCNEFRFDQSKTDSDEMDSNEYGLIDDIFLVNELSSSTIPNSNGDSSIFSSSDDEIMDILKSSVDERKPFDNFEKQITLSVPQPPPLKTNAFAIGSGLFDGIFLSIIVLDFLRFIDCFSHNRYQRSHKYSANIFNIANRNRNK